VCPDGLFNVLPSTPVTLPACTNAVGPITNTDDLNGAPIKGRSP
jgi:hypothetical protein